MAKRIDPHGRTSIAEGTTDRPWARITPERVELIGEIVLEYGPITQQQITYYTQDILGCPSGTAQRIVSTALLQLRHEKLVRPGAVVESENGGRTRIWEFVA